MGPLRKDNWESLLAKELVKSKTLSFKYGENDCTIWATNMLKSYSDLNWEATWTNKKEALRLQKSKPMEDQVSEVLGPPRVNLNLTKRGDLVQKDKDMSAALGICIGSKVAFLKPKEGICYADLQDCTYSWET